MAPVGIAQLADDGPVADRAPGRRSRCCTAGTLAAGVANVVVVHGLRLLGTDPGDRPPVPRAGDGGRARGDLPRRADPAGPGVGGVVILAGVALLRGGDAGDRAESVARSHEAAEVEPRSAANRRRPSRRVRPDEPPLAILVDYDGTIALTDVSDSVMAEHVPATGRQRRGQYDAGSIGSRQSDGAGRSASGRAPIRTADGDGRRGAAARPGVRPVRPARAGRPASRSRSCRTASASSSGRRSSGSASATCPS